jgi:hypothetical protein
MVVAAMSPLECRPHARFRPGVGKRAIALISLCVSAAWGTVGCGHPATPQECQAIVDRLVELELKEQHVSDPAEIARRRRTSLGAGDSGGTPADIVKDCLGRHLTDRAMACVRSAQTPAEVSERCLR